MSGDPLSLDAIEEIARMAEPDPYCMPADAATVLALVAEVRRLRDWQRKVSDACELTEIHMGYTPWVPDATPEVVAMIRDTFTRSLHHAECERVEWEQARARGEI